ncbi:hypothetical protein D083_2531 [Dickeya solani RNS 08.23.3.1.A]|nr:hypothetical protein D083_2531 [Dickeya solani RNS 08.23.3.1.A]
MNDAIIACDDSEAAQRSGYLSTRLFWHYYYFFHVIQVGI